MTRLALMLAPVTSLAIAAMLATPALAQSMPGMDMPGMTMPMPPAKRSPAKASPRPAAPAKRPVPTMPADHATMPGMDHEAMPGMAMPAPAPPPGGHAMPGMAMPGDGEAAPGAPVSDAGESGTALPAGTAPAPAIPTDHAADRAYPAGEMAMARHHLQQHHGGQRFSQVMLNLAEYQFRNGRDGFRWDGRAWFGGDIDRLAVKTEGDGAFGKGIDSAEVQALYSHAIGPYFNLQAGVRQDLGRTPRRSYATVGIEGLASGFFDVEAALFVSNRGGVLGRLEGYYDQRITQRLILQPRVELNFAAQDVPANRIGAGLSNAELGLRLRYEVRREFAPYVGVSWDRRIGTTARYARADGDRASTKSIVVGARMWF